MTTSRKKESLDEEVNHIVEESRMVLPGIQALFGFQLIAVFNQRFDQLPPVGRVLHLVSLVLVALAIALIMAPAAYHRQAEQDSISRFFADYASTLITVAMMPLVIALNLDVALVCFVITRQVWIAVALGSALAGFFTVFWFVIPRSMRSRLKRGQGPRAS